MTLLAVGLLVGCAAAFTYTEALKLERTPVGRAQVDRWLSPACDCPGDTTSIRFRLREQERIDVTVLDEEGEVVRTLASGLSSPGGTVELAWDGRNEARQVVADGAYRVRVRLLDERRSIVVPVDMNVDTKAPRVRLRSVSAPTIVEGETLLVRYWASEPGTPVLLVRGEPALRATRRRAGSRGAQWRNVVDELAVPPGTPLAFAVEDRAGNLSEPTQPITIVAAETPTPR
jgi:FlgD Ig-like domain